MTTSTSTRFEKKRMMNSFLCQSAPYQKSLNEWATYIMQLLKLRQGGPRLNKEGKICFDTAPTGSRWKHGPRSSANTSQQSHYRDGMRRSHLAFRKPGAEQVGSSATSAGEPSPRRNQNSERLKMAQTNQNSLMCENVRNSSTCENSSLRDGRVGSADSELCGSVADLLLDSIPEPQRQPTTTTTTTTLSLIHI